MSDFKSFQNQQRRSNSAPQGDQKKNGQIPFNEKEVLDFAKQYENSSEQEVLSDLLNAARVGKQNGTFDMSQMEQFAGTLSGVLNDQQKKRLQEVMKMLKNT